MLKLLTISVLLLAFATCTRPTRRAVNKPTATATPTPAAKPQQVTAPPPINKNAPIQKGAGSIEEYNYTYELTGGQATVEFAPKKLPFDQGIVVAASRKVIETIFGEKMEGFPRRAVWTYKDSDHAVLLEGQAYDYVFVHVRDESGDIPTLIFWRVEKGSVSY